MGRRALAGLTLEVLLFVDTISFLVAPVELVLVATFSLVLTSLSFLILSSGCLLFTLVVRFMISESTSWGV